MKKVLISIIVLGVLGFTLFPSANADFTLIEMNDQNSAMWAIAALYPSASSTTSGSAMTFDLPYNAYITAFSVELIRVGNPSFTISARLENVTSLSADPTGSIIETSVTTFEASSISNSSVFWYTFQFTGDILFSTSNYYALVIYVSDYTTADGSNKIDVYGANSNVINGYGGPYYSLNWALYTDEDMSYVIYGNTLTSATPTPGPSEPPTELTDIWATIGDLIALLVPLLVVLLPAFFGYKFAGAWGFLAGINVGAILAYVVLGAATFPLWGIVAILILDALLLFGKVGFRT